MPPAPPTRAEQRRHDDALLVARAQTELPLGGRDAITQLHRRYAKMIHAILLARVPPEDADDLAQEVFIRGMQRLPQLRKPESFGAWLATMARNAAHDFHRRKRPARSLDDDDVHGSTLAQAPQAAPKLEAKRVHAVICKLPESYREILLMRLVEGMTGPEIAARTGRDAGSVRVTLHRGMAKLRKRLGDPRQARPRAANDSVSHREDPQ